MAEPGPQEDCPVCLDHGCVHHLTEETVAYLKRLKFEISFLVRSLPDL